MQFRSRRETRAGLRPIMGALAAALLAASCANTGPSQTSKMQAGKPTSSPPPAHAAATAPATAAHAAPSFDGDWKGFGRATKCWGTEDYAIHVVAATFAGTWDYSAVQAGAKGTLEGSVSPDGKLSGVARSTFYSGGGVPKFTGSFSGNSFSGEVTGARCGTWVVTMERK